MVKATESLSSAFVIVATLPGKNKATKLKTAIVEKKTGALLAVVIGVRTSGPGKSLGCDKKPSLLPSVFRPNSVTLGKFR